MIDVEKITPEPTPQQRSAIEQAIRLAWPKTPVPSRQPVSKWRFAARRWGRFNK